MATFGLGNKNPSLVNAKKPRMGSKPVSRSSRMNSRKTPPPSIPASSRPCSFIISTCTRLLFRSGTFHFVSNSSIANHNNSLYNINRRQFTVLERKIVKCVLVQMRSSDSYLVQIRAVARLNCSETLQYLFELED